MIQKFWSARSRREQILIVMALLLLGLGGGALPLIQYHDDLAIKASAWQQERLQAERLVQSIQEYRGGAGATVSIPVSPALLSNLDASLQAHELKSSVKKLELKDPQHSVLSIKNVDFLSLIDWLKAIHADMQVQVTQADLGASDEVGQVNADLILEVSSH